MNVLVQQPLNITRRPSKIMVFEKVSLAAYAQSNYDITQSLTSRNMLSNAVGDLERLHFKIIVFYVMEICGT